MTPLGARLVRQIEATGPITLADFMATCLMDPEHGYYATRDPFGVAGDFTTAPEISQMFGELVGLAIAQAWVDQGKPTPCVLAELGPGRGTLMADALRATKTVPGFRDAAQTFLVEASPTLTEIQGRTLIGQKITWVTSVADLPAGPLFVIANEFFDALPIRQFKRATAGWAERMVGAEAGQLVWGLSPVMARPELVARMPGTQAGDVVETCAPAEPIMAEIAGRIGAEGGLALIFDYGWTQSKGDTFQALRGHTPVDPLAEPGQADLTAHVDFGALASVAMKAAPVQMVQTDQGVLLERLGITARAQILARRLSGPALQNHIAAHRRLTDPAEMGTLFQAMAIAPAAAPLPPGFE